MAAIGTGLIMLGVNAARVLKGIPMKGWTTTIGAIAIAWGTLDHFFDLSLWLSFALLLIVTGVVLIASLLVKPKTG